MTEKSFNAADMAGAEQQTISALNDVRKMLIDLLATESNDRFMRIRLVASVKMVDAMIAAHNKGRATIKNIRSARKQKSR